MSDDQKAEDKPRLTEDFDRMTFGEVLEDVKEGLAAVPAQALVLLTPGQARTLLSGIMALLGAIGRPRPEAMRWARDAVQQPFASEPDKIMARELLRLAAAVRSADAVRPGAWRVVHNGESLGMLAGPGGRTLRLQELGTNDWWPLPDNDAMCMAIAAALNMERQRVPEDVLERARQWRQRADDAGFLAREVLSLAGEVP